MARTPLSASNSAVTCSARTVRSTRPWPPLRARRSRSRYSSDPCSHHFYAPPGRQSAASASSRVKRGSPPPRATTTAGAGLPANGRSQRNHSAPSCRCPGPSGPARPPTLDSGVESPHQLGLDDHSICDGGHTRRAIRLITRNNGPGCGSMGSANRLRPTEDKSSLERRRHIWAGNIPTRARHHRAARNRA
jgi:hypothetical protein